MDENHRPLPMTILSGLLAFTGLGTALFWILYFAGKMKATETKEDEAYERAFPVADSWMTCCCLVAAKNILKMNRKGLFAGIAAGSSMMFLACLDILYSLENRKYWPLDSDRAQMLVVHLWAGGTAFSTLRLLWKYRDAFQGD